MEKEKWFDSNTQAVVEKMIQRMNAGENKYGVSTDREDIDFIGWITHLQEELMDAAIYCEKLKKMYKKIIQDQNDVV